MTNQHQHQYQQLETIQGPDYTLTRPNIELNRALTSQFIAQLDVSEPSKNTYTRAIKPFTFYLETIDVTRPTRDTILAHKRELITLEAHTARLYLSVVRMFFKWTESVGEYPNIAHGIKSPATPKGFRKDVLSKGQAISLLESDTSQRDHALISLLLHTGLRTIEAQRADVIDIQNQGGHTVLHIQGKGRSAKDEYAILPTETVELLAKYLDARGPIRVSAPLFASESDRNKGGRLTTKSISRIVKNALRGNGIDNRRVTAHSLRHTAITCALLGGATLQETQRLARHSNINTTLIYSHNLDRLSNPTEQKIADYLSQ